MDYIRLNKNASSFEEAFQYYKERSKQLGHAGYRVVSLQDLGTGAFATIQSLNTDAISYGSIFVYSQHRGNNSYMKLYNTVADKNTIIFTLDDCRLVDFLSHKGISYTMDPGMLESSEYYDISQEYKNDIAVRSGQPLMNHIDEGLHILSIISASDDAKLGYILHPLFQSDKLMVKYQAKNLHPYSRAGIINAVEYRNVANAYLSTRKIESISEIKLSPLKDVNDMLIADKIQNYKDFMKYHHGKHPRSKELYEYFHNWFKKLDLHKSFVETIIQALNNQEDIKCM